ncbi:MAG TPA: hypothetical protein V6C72_16175 [Chroococcales cyanobacterium]
MATSTFNNRGYADLDHEARDEVLRKAINLYNQSERPHGMVGWIIVMAVVLALAIGALTISAQQKHEARKAIETSENLPGNFLPIVPMSGPMIDTHSAQ